MPIVGDLWPTAQATVASGLTAVRGKLIGSAVARTKVEIADAAGTFDRFTRADSSGEFLFPLPIRVKPQADGRISLTVQVASGTRAVTSVDILSGLTTDHVVGASFLLVPGRASRVKFNVT